MGYLICGECGKKYEETQAVWCCDCGGLLDYKGDSIFDVGKVDKSENSLWRYHHVLPVSFENRVSFGEGFTPLQKICVKGKDVLFKFDHIFPSGSYKDRGATVLVSKIKELGIEQVVEDSSGNAGAAIAAYCAKAGIKSKILVPANNSLSKLKQISQVGAELVTIEGSRQDVADKALELAHDSYYASHSYNPYFFEGTKTFAFEICEQLGWDTPDVVVLPVGNGTLLLGAYMGFKQLLAGGVISKLPKIIGVQAENCSPLAKSFESGNYEKILDVVVGETLAEGIAISKPIRFQQILQAVRDSDGFFVTVSEDHLKDAWSRVQRMGIYIEPTAVAAYVGVEKYLESRGKNNEIVVSVFTGHGLKK